MVTVWRADADYEATRRRMVWNASKRFDDDMIPTKCFTVTLDKRQ